MTRTGTCIWLKSGHLNVHGLFNMGGLCLSLRAHAGAVLGPLPHAASRLTSLTSICLSEVRCMAGGEVS